MIVTGRHTVESGLRPCARALTHAVARQVFTSFFLLLLFLVPNLEEEVSKLPDKDGWIRINEFMKFAMPSDLCKIEFHDRVFQKVDYDEEKKKNEAKKESKVKVNYLLHR